MKFLKPCVSGFLLKRDMDYLKGAMNWLKCMAVKGVEPDSVNYNAVDSRVQCQGQRSGHRATARRDACEAHGDEHSHLHSCERRLCGGGGCVPSRALVGADAP